MATYPVRNKKTGEEKEIQMSIHDWDQWREDNPDWERFYTPYNSPMLGLEMGDPLSKIYTKAIQVGRMLSALLRSNQEVYQNTTTNFMPRKSKSGIGSTNPVPFDI